MSDEFIPIARPDVSEEEIAEVIDSLRSGWITYGPKTQQFEAEFAEATGAKFAVALNSCTAGMHLALIAAGIGPGDEVITTPITFSATVNVIVHVGATPVLADVCAEDLNIDPDAIAAKITPRTKALLPMHYGGQACRMDEIMDLARRHNLKVIEDAAHAAGAAYKGRQIGSIGHASAFSFYPTKNMTTSEGGMLTTDDPDLAEMTRVLRKHGLSTDAWKRHRPDGNSFYDVVAPGFNYCMTDVQAAIGRGQLKRLPEFNARRAEIAARYIAGLEAIEEIETPVTRPEVTHGWHLYVIRLKLDGLRIGRNEFEKELRARKIGTSVNFIPIHYHSYYREGFGFHKGDYPVAEDAFERMLSLPMYPGMTDEDVDRIVGAVEEIVEQHRA
ncbi:MAG: DegT/DnrJ/EryC1/StrS family aminotransferase [Dehalococcoidia bacterium]